jgi:hypothetical protein
MEVDGNQLSKLQFPLSLSKVLSGMPIEPRNTKLKGRLSTVNLLATTCTVLLLYINRIFNLLSKMS